MAYSNASNINTDLCVQIESELSFKIRQLQGTRILNVTELPKHNAYVWINSVEYRLVDAAQLRLRHLGSKTTDSFRRLLKNCHHSHHGALSGAEQLDALNVPAQRTIYVPL